MCVPLCKYSSLELFVVVVTDNHNSEFIDKVRPTIPTFGGAVLPQASPDEGGIVFTL